MIVYATRTGNTKYIAEHLQLPHQPIHKPINEPFVLLTYTDGIGQVPLEVKEFMDEHYTLCRGILVSGNSNFGAYFGGAGDVLARQYKLQLGMKFELRGTTDQYEAARAFYRKVMQL